MAILKTAMNKDSMHWLECRDLEIDLFLEAIYRKYKHDYRNYNRSMIKRKLVHKARSCGFSSISAMQAEVLYNEEFFNCVVADFSINTTEMFRDASFFKSIRENVIPILTNYPACKIWHAGCSTGEEVYSMAIILKEHGLYEKCKIYATDINEVVLKTARTGIFPIAKAGSYARNYRDSGGLGSFAGYFTANYNHAIIDSLLKKNIIFSYHNLSTDRAFCEADLIFCRNVLIYFDENLLHKALALICSSLNEGGVLCLGSQETINYTEFASGFKNLIEGKNIFIKNQRFSEHGK